MDLMTLTTLCQWTGALAGACGAWAVGSQAPCWRFWGFTGFAISNVVLIFAFCCMASWPLLGMQIIFLLTSARGMRNNYVAWTAEARVGDPLMNNR